MKKFLVSLVVAAMLMLPILTFAPPTLPPDPPGGGGGCTTLSYAADDNGPTLNGDVRLLYSSSDCDSIRLYVMMHGDQFFGTNWEDGVQQVVFDIYYDPDMSFTGTLGVTQFINHDLCEVLPGFPLATSVNCSETTGLPGVPSSHGQQTSKVTCNILRQPTIPGCPYHIDPFNVLAPISVIGLQFTKTTTGQHSRFTFPFDGSIPDGNPKVTTPAGVKHLTMGYGGLVTIP